MKKLCCLIVIVCVSLLVISAALASDNQHLDTDEGGVKVIVKYDPLGPNNLIVAFVKFVNTNSYKVHVNWKPIITCEGSDVKKGYGEPFVMSEGGSYQVTVWRSVACGDRNLKDLSVEMDVKKATDN